MSIATRSDDIIRAVAQVAGSAPRPLALHEPYFHGNEGAYTQSCIDTGWVSTAGAFVERFERELATICGAKHAVAVVNGTCALHAALTVCGVQLGDEVIVPSLTFVATANAVVHAGAVPHFVEVEEASLGIDPAHLRTYLSHIVSMENGLAVNRQTGRILRAIVPVHVFGHPCDILALRAVADEFGLLLIEDATEALGSQVAGKPIGAEGIAIFSFNGNKIITTGGGGAILTDNDALYARLKHLTATAKQPHPYAFEHDAVAWNYRLPNLNAALGCAQLEQLTTFVGAKRALAKQYIEAFSGMAGARIVTEPAGTRSNYWLVTLLTEQGDDAWLAETMAALHHENMLCRPVWKPLHLLPMFQACPRSHLHLTESLATRLINLPSSVKLGLTYV